MDNCNYKTKFQILRKIDFKIDIKDFRGHFPALLLHCCLSLTCVRVQGCLRAFMYKANTYSYTYMHS